MQLTRIQRNTAIALTVFFMLFGLLSFLAAKPANAAGSDGTTPYTVTNEGVQLPDGVVFEDGGHVNVKSNQGDKGIHFEALNNQPSGAYIGKSFLPWSALGYDASTLCVGWVQLSQYNEHFGEGGQVGVGLGCAPVVPPVEEPPVVTPPVEEPPVVTPPSDEPPFICGDIYSPSLIAGGWLTPDEWLNCGCPEVPAGIETPVLLDGYACPAVVIPTPEPTPPVVGPAGDIAIVPVEAPVTTLAADGTTQLAETGVNGVGLFFGSAAAIAFGVTGFLIGWRRRTSTK